MSERCRHNRTWVLAGGYLLWCYECGALRQMKFIPGEPVSITAIGGWIKPVGKGGENPCDKLVPRCEL